MTRCVICLAIKAFAAENTSLAPCYRGWWGWVRCICPLDWALNHAEYSPHYALVLSFSFAKSISCFNKNYYPVIHTLFCVLLNPFNI